MWLESLYVVQLGVSFFIVLADCIWFWIVPNQLEGNH